MIERVNVIGRGRVGAAIAARLQERGLALDETDPELVLLCVPDRAIGEAAAYVSLGPWVAHVSGATPLAELAPHTRRFSVHPLQTFTVRRGAEQLDGAWGAVTAETEDARVRRNVARRDPRAARVPSRRREPRDLPRRSRNRLQLPRHPPRRPQGRCSKQRGRRPRLSTR